MQSQELREIVPCPFCTSQSHQEWARDNGFTAVRCGECGLVYVNPRPNMALVHDAVKTGTHSADANGKTVVTRRIESKVARYRSLFAEMFSDVWKSGRAVSWVDVGAGFGEVIEAVGQLAPRDSNIVGLEPMKPKAEAGRSRGLDIQEKYLNQLDGKFEFLSLINVFSHIPDFHSFLHDARNALSSGGEIIIETGDTADFDRSQIPGEIDLPDHLVFAAERHLIGFLQKAGFEIVSVKKERIDTCKEFIKDVVKATLGRPVAVRWPYTSPYRTMFIRAKLSQPAA